MFLTGLVTAAVLKLPAVPRTQRKLQQPEARSPGQNPGPGPAGPKAATRERQQVVRGRPT